MRLLHTSYQYASNRSESIPTASTAVKRPLKTACLSCFEPFKEVCNTLNLPRHAVSVPPHWRKHSASIAAEISMACASSTGTLPGSDSSFSAPASSVRACDERTKHLHTPHQPTACKAARKSMKAAPGAHLGSVLFLRPLRHHGWCLRSCWRGRGGRKGRSGSSSADYAITRAGLGRKSLGTRL
jgi:hypothetical protein